MAHFVGWVGLTGAIGVYLSAFGITRRNTFLMAFGLGVVSHVLWEIFEYAMDTLFGFNMMKSGLPDTMGDFIEKFPEYTDELKRWTQSDNRWMRRAAAVSLIVPAKHGKFLKESIEIAGLLLTDTDDMVQKGYGWLLKEASRKHTSEVFMYVMKNKKVMPND